MATVRGPNDVLLRSCVKAVTTDRSVSDLVSAAVLESLREDAVDLEAFDRRAKEPSRPFQKVLEALKRSLKGKAARS